jgi:hypothetical protein
MPDTPAPPLQPLRIPAGWCVTYNAAFYELDPLDPKIAAHDRWWILKEDMLQLRHGPSNRLADLGWYPEGDLSGHFGLVLYEGDFNGRLIHRFNSRNRLDIVAELERILDEVARGTL